MGPLKAAIIHHLLRSKKALQKAAGLKILELRRVTVNEVGRTPHDSKIFSGKNFLIDVLGEIHLLEKVKDRELEGILTYVVQLLLQYNIKKESFKVLETNNLVVQKIAL